MRCGHDITFGVAQIPRNLLNDAHRFMSTNSLSSQQSMFLKKDAQHYNYIQLFLGGDGLDALAARVDDLQILLFCHLNVSAAAESVDV